MATTYWHSVSSSDGKTYINYRKPTSNSSFGAKITSNNIEAGGYPIVDAFQVAGHHVVGSEAQLYCIPQEILSPNFNNGKGIDEGDTSEARNGEDSLGQIWYVNKSKKYYRLDKFPTARPESFDPTKTLDHYKGLTGAAVWTEVAISNASDLPWFKYGNGVFANIQTDISYANEHYPDLFDGDIVIGDSLYIKDSQTTALFGNINNLVGGAANIISGQFNSSFNLTQPTWDSTKNNLVVGQQNQAYTVGVNINTGELAFDSGSYLKRYDFSGNLVNGTDNYIVGNTSNIISSTNSYLFNNQDSLISSSNNEFFGNTYIGKVYFKNDFPNTGDYCYTYIPNVNIDAVNIYPDKLDNDVFARTMLRVPIIYYYDKADINSRKNLGSIVSTYSYKNSNNELWSINWTPYKRTTPFAYESAYAYTIINSFAENNRNSIIQGAANYVSNCTHAFVCGTYLVDIDNHDKVLLGQWNKIEDGNNNALTIGGGTGPRDRKNIFTIDTDGTTYTSKDFRIGDKSTSVSVLKKSPLPGNEIEYVWSGTQEKYDALGDEVAKHPDTLFIIHK